MFSQGTTTRIQDLQEALQSLESLQLPVKFRQKHSNGNTNNNNDDDASSAMTATVDLAIIERYKQAREQYLKRCILQRYVHHVKQLDGTNSSQSLEIATPTPEQWQHLHDQREQVQAQISGLMKQIEHKIPQLQAQYITLQSRQEEMHQVLKDLQDYNDTHENDMDENNDEEMGSIVDVSEEELQAQEEKLEQLHQRRVQILQELQSVQKDNMRIQVALQKQKVQLQEFNIDQENITPEIVEDYKKKAAESSEKIAKVRKIRDFYDSLRQLMEELSGMKIVKVDKDTDGILMQVQLQQKHTLEVKLCTTASSKQTLRISSAKWITPTLLPGPPNSQGVVTFSMHIPPVDDFVRLALPLPPGDDLRFLLHQSLARVTCLTRRVEELSILQQQPDTLVKIGQTYHDPCGFGGQDQEVICSLNSALLTVVLRLGPECPMMPQSVTIDKIVAMGGWNETVLQDVQNEVMQQLDDKTSASPVQVIRILQETLAEWTKKGKLQLPRTPKLPQRPGF